MNAVWRVIQYPAIGHRLDPDTTSPVHTKTFATEQGAVWAVREAIGGDFGCWADPSGGNGLWFHESNEEGCGGFCIEMLEFVS